MDAAKPHLVRHTRHRVLVSAATALSIAGVTYGGYALNAWLRYGKQYSDLPVRNALADKYLPQFEIRERHETTVNAPADVTYDVAYHLDLQSSAIVRAIFAARALLFRSGPAKLPPRSEFLDEAVALGWGILDEQPGRRLLLGAVTKPWEPSEQFIAAPPGDFAAFNSPGFAKIVWTLEADELTPATSVFRTETRVVTTDAESRRRFRRYWAFMSPGILIIRREALRLVKGEAERQAANERNSHV